jgi:hypothetical protein
MFQNDVLPAVAGNMALAEMLIRLLIDFISIVLLVRYIYYPLHRQKDYLFTFFLFNLLIFITCLLLSTSHIKLGFAFGLFAIFSIMRYRTVVIPIKEMGYFFVCVATAIFNALVDNTDYYLLPVAANLFILTLVFILDRYITLNHESYKEILYERIDLVKPQNEAAMLRDLSDRTGLPVHRVEVLSIDFLHDTAVINAYYYKKQISK